MEENRPLNYPFHISLASEKASLLRRPWVVVLSGYGLSENHYH